MAAEILVVSADDVFQRRVPLCAAYTSSTLKMIHSKSDQFKEGTEGCIVLYSVPGHLLAEVYEYWCAWYERNEDHRHLRSAMPAPTRLHEPKTSHVQSNASSTLTFRPALPTCLQLLETAMYLGLEELAAICASTAAEGLQEPGTEEWDFRDLPEEAIQQIAMSCRDAAQLCRIEQAYEAQRVASSHVNPRLAAAWFHLYHRTLSPLSPPSVDLDWREAKSLSCRNFLESFAAQHTKDDVGLSNHHIRYVSERIKRFSLKNPGLPGSAFVSIINSLTSTTHYDLTGYHLNRSCGHALASTLRTCSIRRLDLSHNRLTAASVSSVAAALRQRPEESPQPRNRGALDLPKGFGTVCPKPSAVPKDSVVAVETGGNMNPPKGGTEPVGSRNSRRRESFPLLGLLGTEVSTAHHSESDSDRGFTDASAALELGRASEPCSIDLDELCSPRVSRRRTLPLPLLASCGSVPPSDLSTDTPKSFTPRTSGRSARNYRRSMVHGNHDTNSPNISSPITGSFVSTSLHFPALTPRGSRESSKSSLDGKERDSSASVDIIRHKYAMDETETQDVPPEHERTGERLPLSISAAGTNGTSSSRSSRKKALRRYIPQAGTGAALHSLLGGNSHSQHTKQLSGSGNSGMSMGSIRGMSVGATDSPRTPQQQSGGVLGSPNKGGDFSCGGSPKRFRRHWVRHVPQQAGAAVRLIDPANSPGSRDLPPLPVSRRTLLGQFGHTARTPRVLTPRRSSSDDSSCGSADESLTATSTGSGMNGTVAGPSPRVISLIVRDCGITDAGLRTILSFGSTASAAANSHGHATCVVPSGTPSSVTVPSREDEPSPSNCPSNIISEGSVIPFVLTPQNSLSQTSQSCHLSPKQPSPPVPTTLCQRLATLTWLDLSSNTIGDAGAVAVAKALTTNRTLTRLSLSNAGISPEGLCSLARALTPTADSECISCPDDTTPYSPKTASRECGLLGLGAARTDALLAATSSSGSPRTCSCCVPGTRHVCHHSTFPSSLDATPRVRENGRSNLRTSQSGSGETFEDGSAGPEYATSGSPSRAAAGLHPPTMEIHNSVLLSLDLSGNGAGGGSLDQARGRTALIHMIARNSTLTSLCLASMQWLCDGDVLWANYDLENPESLPAHLPPRKAALDATSGTSPSKGVVHSPATHAPAALGGTTASGSFASLGLAFRDARQALAEALRYNQTLTNLDLSSGSLAAYRPMETKPGKGGNRPPLSQTQSQPSAEMHTLDPHIRPSAFLPSNEDLSNEFGPAPTFREKLQPNASASERLGPGIVEFGTALSQHPALTSLNLSNNSLAPETMKHFVPVSSTTLCSLNLSGNAMDIHVATAVAALLRSSRVIRELNLRGTVWSPRATQSSGSGGGGVRVHWIGDEGVRVIALALTEAGPLTSLSLSRQGIRSEGGKCLAEALLRSQVTYLDLSDNFINSPTAMAVARAARARSRASDDTVTGVSDNDSSHGVGDARLDSLVDSEDETLRTVTKLTQVFFSDKNGEPTKKPTLPKVSRAVKKAEQSIGSGLTIDMSRNPDISEDVRVQLQAIGIKVDEVDLAVEDKL
eukprot:Rmarinus@m.5577